MLHKKIPTFHSTIPLLPSALPFTTSWPVPSQSSTNTLAVCTLYRACRFSAAITVEELTNILSVVDNGGRAGEEHTSLESRPTTMRIAAVAS